VTSAHCEVVAASPALGIVATPRRKPNVELRSREYLTEAEVERLRTSARTGNRHGDRDEAMILVAYRHGLRASELVSLRWDAIELEQGKLHCSRRKNGKPSVHPMTDSELRALRRLRKQAPLSRYVFLSERGTPFTVGGFRRMITRLGVKAAFSLALHPHMLRHACGYTLANAGRDTRAIQDYLGQEYPAHGCVHRAGVGSF
jgi:integrase